jgi:hypothetical protein
VGHTPLASQAPLEAGKVFCSEFCAFSPRFAHSNSPLLAGRQAYIRHDVLQACHRGVQAVIFCTILKKNVYYLNIPLF